MTSDFGQSSDAQTTPVGVRTNCPQCGVQLDSVTTTCGACGAVITGGALDAERMERVRLRLQQGIGDGYKLAGMLGRGGMGMVFQARESALDRDVALKILAFDPILNPDAYMRFEREAKLAARLDHPNIVPIFAVGQGNGIAFYTMRMVKGGSVEGMLAGGKSLDIERGLDILEDVASALDYAHAQGVVHRDIKPANILIGDAGHAMVADFGIARAVTGSGGGQTATGTGVVGSPAYMSPEQWRGEKVDGRADQYALAVLAFEIFTGTRPFKSDSMQELLRLHLQEEAPDVISIRTDLPPRLSDPIRRALSKDASQRFTSSREFIAALRGEDVPPAPPPMAAIPGASAPTVRTPAPPPFTRGPTGTQPTGARPAVGTGTGSPRASTISAAVPAEAAVAESAPAEKRSLGPWLALLVIALAGAGVIWRLAPPRQQAPQQPPAPAISAATLDSIQQVEKRMQAEIDDARRAAMDAERRADALAAAKSTAATPEGGSKAPAAPKEPAHAHLYVFAQGGTPQIVVDGAPKGENAPALLQVPPGKHTVSVKGAQPFFPVDTVITLAPEDTQTIVFRARRQAAPAASNQQGRAAPGASTSGPARGDSIAIGQFMRRDPNSGQLVPDWPAIIQKLGFDPRTANPRTLTAPQKLAYRRWQVMMDSARRASGKP